MKDIIVTMIGVVLWFSMYLFIEVKFKKVDNLKKKPIIRSLILFFYMYLGIMLIKTIL